MTEEPRTGWRYRLGVWLFLLPVLSFVATPIVVPFLGLDAGAAAALVGAILVTGEVIWLASIPLLGKEGFERIKGKVFGLVRIPPGPVSHGRHRLGVVLFVGGLVGEMLVVLLLIYAYFRYAPGEYPEGRMLGITFETQALLFVAMQIASALAVVAAMYLLGGGFVDRLRTAFSWPREPEQGPGK